MMLDNRMISSEVNKWNYLEEDTFHIVEVVKRFKENIIYYYSCNKKSKI